MLEKDIENIIAQHPEDVFPDEGLKLIGQQIIIEGRRVDILFEDKHQRQVIIEVKRGILTREASGQITEYYGLLKNTNKDKIYELILCANIIPKERKTFLEAIGIECKELGVLQIIELAKKYDYKFIDDQSIFSSSNVEDIIRYNKNLQNTINSDDEISIWVFQGNPNKYDILNALSDKDIGNTIHWLVSQNKRKIHKGHLVLLWMSGKEAGIYALARVECEPAIMTENGPEKKYWIVANENKINTRVQLSILKRFINKPILKKDLLDIPQLSKLSILKQFQGTNFPVKDSEWKIIYQLM
ncbi:MAG: EVE domain-containing protein [Desulfobacterales bacterium]|nr:EVE domain-containing protein [Desulfobacterales bacterium]